MSKVNVVGMGCERRSVAYLLDVHFNVVPIHDVKKIDLFSLSNKWGYQTALLGGKVLSSTFLSVDVFNPYIEIYKPTVFETALLMSDFVEVIGRFSTVDDCIECHHDYLNG